MPVVKAIRKWFQDRKALKSGARYAKSRSFKRAEDPYPSRKDWRFRTWRSDEQDRRRIEQLIACGQRLEELMKQPGWQDILALRDSLLYEYDRQSKLSKDPDTPQDERQRTIAAARWSALRAFFNQLRITVIEAERAERAKHASKNGKDRLEESNPFLTF